MILCWSRVGYGRCILVFKDKRVSTLSGARIARGKDVGVNEEMQVWELMNETKKSRNANLLDSLFDEFTVQKMKATPISWLGEDDCVYWSFSTNRVYSVISGYQLAKNKFHVAGTSSNSNSNGFWKRVWFGATLPKCKNHIWRACSDTLLVSQNLRKKRVDVDPRCPMCGFVC